MKYRTGDKKYTRPSCNIPGSVRGVDRQPTHSTLPTTTHPFRQQNVLSLSLLHTCGSPFLKQILCAVQRIKVRIYGVDRSVTERWIEYPCNTKPVKTLHPRKKKKIRAKHTTAYIKQISSLF